MVKYFLKFSVTHLLMLSLITFVFFSSSMIYAQSIESINSVQAWHSQVDNYPGISDGTMILIVAGVVALGVATYFIIKSGNSNADTIKTNSSESDTTSQLINTNVYSICKSHYSNIEKIKDQLPFQITAGWRRNNLSFTSRQLYLGVKVKF
jgi:hypothetical protein